MGNRARLTAQLTLELEHRVAQLEEQLKGAGIAEGEEEGGEKKKKPKAAAAPVPVPVPVLGGKVDLKKVRELEREIARLKQQVESGGGGGRGGGFSMSGGGGASGQDLEKAKQKWEAEEKKRMKKKDEQIAAQEKQIKALKAKLDEMTHTLAATTKALSIYLSIYLSIPRPPPLSELEQLKKTAAGAARAAQELKEKDAVRPAIFK
eukprot:tig00000911_g5407.t1